MPLLLLLLLLQVQDFYREHTLSRSSPAAIISGENEWRGTLGPYFESFPAPRSFPRAGASERVDLVTAALYYRDGVRAPGRVRDAPTAAAAAAVQADAGKSEVRVYFHVLRQFKSRKGSGQ
uniref:Putative secreted protein n=1 Tax=Anopheles triannulatus TaxID=58253 RepID=A0A2M4B292_9DIPT